MSASSAPYFVEYQKVRCSLALVIAVIVPLLIAVFTFCNVLRGNQPRPWDMWMLSVCAVWAFFMLPMSVIALTALVAQTEHAPRSWDHLRALPVPRWRLYVAKAVMIMWMMALMTVMVYLTGAAAIWLAGKYLPLLAATGHFDGWRYIFLLSRMYLSSTLLIAVQLWLALRYASFVPALAVGIGGTFFAVVGTSARIGVLLPWQIPVNMLSRDPARADLALLIGFLGGVLLLVGMLAHLSRREIR